MTFRFNDRCRTGKKGRKRREWQMVRHFLTRNTCHSRTTIQAKAYSIIYSRAYNEFMDTLPKVAQNFDVSVMHFPSTVRRDKAEKMARALTEYRNAGFDWRPVLEKRIICRRTLFSYLNIDMFREKVCELDLLRVQMAESTLFSALTAAPWPQRIQAADKILRALAPEKWDSSLRRELARSESRLTLQALKSMQESPQRQVDITQEIPNEALENRQPL